MIQRLSVPISFAHGLDTKTDPKQVQIGKFLSLQNSIFDKGGLLQKRNGFQLLSSLPNTSYTYLTTLNDNLTAIGPTVAAQNQSTMSWFPKGSISPLQLETLPLIRNNANQTQADSAVAPNGLICTAYTETVDDVNFTYKYVVSDSVTGQNLVAPTILPNSVGTPRVFILGNYFIVIFTTHPSAYHLQFIAISWSNVSIITAPADLTTSYIPSTTVSWDAVVYGQYLYLAFNTTSGGQAIKVISLASTLSLTGLSHTFAASIATMMSVSVDSSNPSVPIIYMSWYDAAGSTGYTAAVNVNVGLVLAPTQIISSGSVQNITCFAKNGSCESYFEIIAAYGYDSSIPTHYIKAISCSQGGTVGSAYVVVRSVGLASKAFQVNGTVYFLSAYKSPFQPTYFLINASTSVAANPIVCAKLAYENGGGYLLNGLPAVTVSDSDIAQVAYLFKDLIEALNTLNNSQQTTAGGIYSQTGINLGTFMINSLGIDTAEIASSLNISGGFLWEYDGYLPVEENFFLWPDSIEAAWSASGGSMAAQPDGSTNTNAYFYQVIYSWTDNVGNVHRSAPSIPVAVTTTGNGTSGSVAINIPTLRLTYKIANPVKIEVYRWSVANQVYYQVSASSSIQNPVLAPLYNATTSDYVTFTDTWADASIIGNNIIYTNGGVIENVNPPATDLITLFDDRLWLVDSEDKNLLWFSKQIIPSTPVEMSDLLTRFIAPTQAAQGSTGPITAIAPMDDKLIIFKQSASGNALYYINGSGPDNTGANNQYSQPIFITSTVGTNNQKSIVFTPDGLMFQSDKGIWTLGRDLSTVYTGAPVQDFTLGATVESAVNVPETNQVRFILDSGITLMYDYYYHEWSTFVGIPAISSCIYNGLHTFINDLGQAYQENPGMYLDGDQPVLLSFTTAWIQLNGIQGYQRIWEMQLLAQYISPHTLNVELAYDFGPISEQATISPINFTGNYGSDSLFGQTSPYGGPGDLEQWRIQPARQKCQSFQLSISEVYDPSFGVAAGAGFTMSAMTAVIGVQRGYRPVKAATTVGAG